MRGTFLTCHLTTIYDDSWRWRELQSEATTVCDVCKQQCPSEKHKIVATIRINIFVHVDARFPFPLLVVDVYVTRCHKKYSSSNSAKLRPGPSSSLALEPIRGAGAAASLTAAIDASGPLVPNAAANARTVGEGVSVPEADKSTATSSSAWPSACSSDSCGDSRLRLLRLRLDAKSARPHKVLHEEPLRLQGACGSVSAEAHSARP